MKKKTSIKPKKTVKKKTGAKKASAPVIKKSAWQEFCLWLHSKLTSLAFWK
jgi:hypothetical protein